MGVLCLPLFWYSILYGHSSFIVILKRKRKLVAFFLLVFGCLVNVNVLWFFLTVTWVGLRRVIVICPNHTHFCFCLNAVEMDGQQCTRFVPCSKY